MSTFSFQLPPPPFDFATNERARVAYLQAVLLFLNTKVLPQIALTLATIQGQDGNTFKVTNNINMNSKQLTNLGSTTDDTQPANRKELKTKALYEQNGFHVADAPIDAKYGVLIPAATQNEEAVQLGQLRVALGAVGIKI